VRSSARFITLEGGEGAGKSTQARHLAEWLRGQGVPVLLTREPGGSPRAEALRELLMAGRVAPFGPEAEALVFAVARAEHLAETIRPALLAGTWVISDRFLDSTWAYQGSAGVAPDVLRRLDAIAVGADRPDLTLILDLPPQTGAERLRARAGGGDRFENDAPELQEARRQAFLRIAEREPDRCVMVDASAPETQVAEAIRRVVEERLAPALAGAA
jgi:dTMP kinase